MTDWQIGNKALSKIEYWIDFIRYNGYEDSLFPKVNQEFELLYESVENIVEIKKVLYEAIASTTLAAVSEPDERKNLVDNQYNRIHGLRKDRFSKMIDDLQQALSKTNIDNFRIVSYNEYEMILAGSTDFEYYHEVEIAFSNMVYVICPMRYFRVNRFRKPTDEEMKDLQKRTVWRIPEFVACMDDTSFNMTHYIIAEEVSVNWDIVFYYERENLQEGERIADWVVKKKQYDI